MVLNENFKEDFQKEKKAFIDDIKKKIQYLVQDVGNKRADAKEKNEILIKIATGAGSELSDSPYKREIDEIERLFKADLEYQKLKNDIISNISDKDAQESALKVLESFKEALPVAEALSADTKELEKIFSSGLNKMITGAESFGDTMKGILNDLKNYFLKAVADAVVQGIVNSTIGNGLSSILAGLGDFTKGSLNGFGGFFSNVLGSIFKFHSGGVVPSGTGGYSLPGTSEYLTLLKGGERVLSPAENTAYGNNSYMNGQNVVVNNFNVKCWDSKDVQKYLLENKNILAGITAENIKYNNANLRFAMGQS